LNSRPIKPDEREGRGGVPGEWTWGGGSSRSCCSELRRCSKDNGDGGPDLWRQRAMKQQNLRWCRWRWWAGSCLPLCAALVLFALYILLYPSGSAAALSHERVFRMNTKTKVLDLESYFPCKKYDTSSLHPKFKHNFHPKSKPCLHLLTLNLN